MSCFCLLLLTASAFFHGKDLVDLSFAIANINPWNRMGVAFRPVWRPRSTPNPAPKPAQGSAPVRVQNPSDESSHTASNSPHPSGQNAIQTVDVVDDDGGKVGQD